MRFFIVLLFLGVCHALRFAGEEHVGGTQCASATQASINTLYCGKRLKMIQ